MKISFSEKIRSGDLNYDFINYLEKYVKDAIRIDEGFIKELKEFCDENDENIEYKIDEIAEDAVSRVKIYCDFDVELEVK